MSSVRHPRLAAGSSTVYWSETDESNRKFTTIFHEVFGAGNMYVFKNSNQLNYKNKYYHWVRNFIGYFETK